MIRCIDLTTSEREHVSLDITPGSFVYLAGEDAPEILSLMTGGTAPDAGSIDVDGINIAALPRPLLELYRRKLGCMLYETPLVPFWTVRDNCAVLLDTPSVDSALSRQLLASCGIADLLDFMPDDLSSDEESKVLLARALIHQPQIVLVDMSVIDARSHTFVLDILETASRQGMTVIIAGIDPTLATAKGMVVM